MKLSEMEIHKIQILLGQEELDEPVYSAYLAKMHWNLQKEGYNELEIVQKFVGLKVSILNSDQSSKEHEYNNKYSVVLPNATMHTELVTN